MARLGVWRISKRPPCTTLRRMTPLKAPPNTPCQKNPAENVKGSSMGLRGTRGSSRCGKRSPLSVSARIQPWLTTTPGRSRSGAARIAVTLDADLVPFLQPAAYVVDIGVPNRHGIAAAPHGLVITRQRGDAGDQSGLPPKADRRRHSGSICAIWARTVSGLTVVDLDRRSAGYHET